MEIIAMVALVGHSTWVHGHDTADGEDAIGGRGTEGTQTF
jgi:hypothetical protein